MSPMQVDLVIEARPCERVLEMALEMDGFMTDRISE